MSTQPQLGLRPWLSDSTKPRRPRPLDQYGAPYRIRIQKLSLSKREPKTRKRARTSQNVMQSLLSCAHRAVIPATAAAASFVSASSRRLSLATAVRLAGEQSADDGPSEIPPLNTLGRSATAVWPALARQRRGAVALANTPVGATFGLMQHRTLHASAAVAAAPKPKGQKREEDLPPPPADDDEVSV